MSLINDALQRAKQSQPANPSTPGSNLQFRPVENTSAPRRGSGLMVPAVIGALLLTAAAVVVTWSYSVKKISARERPPAAASHSAASQTSAARPRTAGGAAPAQPLATATNLAATAAPLPKAPPPKLQAIVFNATRSSAIINGKTVFVGSRVGEFRVTAITPNAATLESDSATNVLTLE